MDTPHKFATLDGMRGLAAIAVVALHVQFTPGATEHISSAFLAVDLFFILSGFVIAHAYSQRLDAGLSWREFMIIRLIRLYPLYFAGLILGVMWRVSEIVFHQPGPLAAEDIARAFALGLFFLPSHAAGDSLDAWPLNAVFWSLFFEILVNALVAIFWPRLSSRVIALVLAISGLTLAATAILTGSLNHGYEFDDLWVGMARATFSIMAGIAIFRGKSFIPNLPVPAAIPMILLAMVLLWPVGGHARSAFDLAAVFVVFPILVIAGFNNPGATLGRLFSIAGTASYAIYTLHRPFTGFVGKAETTLHLSHPVTATAFIASVIVGALVVDRIYDQPVRGWLRTRLLGKRRAAA